MGATHAFLWLCLLLMAEHGTAGNIFSNNEDQCFVKMVVDLALQLQNHSHQLREQSARLEQQSAQLREQSTQLRSLQEKISSMDAGRNETRVWQQSSGELLESLQDKVIDLDRNLTLTINVYSQQAEMIGKQSGQLLSLGDRVKTMESSLKWNRGNLTELNETHHQQGGMLREQSEELRSLQNKTGSMEITLERLTDYVTALNSSGVLNTKVGFMTQVRRRHNLGINEVVKFETVQYNEGDAYNPASGLFTAPVAGMYTFFIKTEVPINKHSRIGVMKEGSRVLYIYASDNSFQTPSAQVVLHLVRGEKVWVQSLPGDINAISTWTRFGGFLVHPDA